MAIKCGDYGFNDQGDCAIFFYGPALILNIRESRILGKWFHVLYWNESLQDYVQASIFPDQIYKWNIYRIKSPAQLKQQKLWHMLGNVHRTLANIRQLQKDFHDECSIFGTSYLTEAYNRILSEVIPELEYRMSILPSRKQSTT